MPMKKILLILCTAMSFAACDMLFNDNNDNNVNNDDFIEVAPSATLTFECEESTETLTVTSSGKWTIGELPEWIEVSPAEGEDGDMLTVSVTENPSEEYRTGMFTLTCGTASKTISVTQYGTIESDPVEVVYTNEYIEGSHSFLFNDGNLVIFTPDSLSGHRIYIDYIDIESGNLSDNDGIIVQCDSEMRPMYAIHKDVYYYFQFHSDDNFDLTVIEDGVEETFSGITFMPDASTKASTEGMTNLEKAGYALDAIKLAVCFKNEGKAAGIEELKKYIVLKVAGLGMDPLSEDLLILGIDLAETYTKNSRLGILGILLGCGDMLNDVAQFVTKRYIGNATPELLSVEQVSAGSASVKYTMTGSNPDAADIPAATVHYKKKGSTWKQTAPRIISDNILYEDIVGNLNYGTYEFRVIVYPSVFMDHPLLQQYYGFKTKIFSLEILQPDCKTGEVSDITSNSVIISCTFEHLPDYGLCQVILSSWYDGERTVQAEYKEGEQSVEISDLQPNTTYSYWASIDYEGGPVNGEVKEFTTKELERPTPGRWVDLGLPSGVKWAGWNVGATRPEEYGGYYAWGETEEKSEYTVETYKHKEKYYYGSDPDEWYWVYKDLGNISGTSYDVATAKWGSGARMPTNEEFFELADKCYWYGGYLNGIAGDFVTGPNGNSIFIPFAGRRYDTDLYFEGDSSWCWPGTQDDGSWDGHWCRVYGLSVRPVSD